MIFPARTLGISGLLYGYWAKMMSISEGQRHAKPPCPRCRSRRVQQVPSSFQAVTSKKA